MLGRSSEDDLCGCGIEAGIIRHLESENAL